MRTTFLTICIFISGLAFLYSQVDTSASIQTPATVIADKDSVSNQNPEEEESVFVEPQNSGKKMSIPLSPASFRLSMYVLAFGLFIIIAEIWIIKSMNICAEDTIKFIIVTLIIIGSLFLITAGYSNDQIAPAVGLLGTIAGYLMGKVSANPPTK